MMNILSHSFTFLLGTATGAAAQYFGTKYTDVRRKQEQESAARQNYQRVKRLVPELIQALQNNLKDPRFTLIREFVVLPNERVVFNSARTRFVYYESKLNNLQDSLLILADNGYIVNVTDGDTPIYRITEEFRKLVLDDAYGA